jgi:hypothetical protein
MPAKTSSQKNCCARSSGELLELQERNFNNWTSLYADQPEGAVTGDTCSHRDQQGVDDGAQDCRTDSAH